MHTWLISAAASRTSFQLVLSNVRLGLWGCFFLEVMRLKFGILGSHIPEFDVTSITVSGLLVRIHLVFFPDVGLLFRCSVKTAAEFVHCVQMREQWFVSFGC